MNRIKELREERGWNQDDLGKRLNVKRAAVSKYENEKIPLTAETIALLCDIFNVSSDYLIGKSEKRLPEEEQPLSEEQSQLLELAEELNEDEKTKLLEYAELLKRGRN